MRGRMRLAAVTAIALRVPPHSGHFFMIISFRGALCRCFRHAGFAGRHRERAHY
jgi:hypothetical protein